MKKKMILKTVAIIAVIVSLVGCVAFSKQISENISVIYDNIKIIIDGNEFKPVDVNGNEVEPFIYNGTTYLPVRAVANAFGKEVGWNPETSTVTLGSQTYERLDKMSYVDYSPEFCSSSEFTMTDGGIRLYQSGGGVWHKEENFPKQIVAYKLDGKYKTFSATIYNNQTNGSGTALKLYGDNKKLIHAFPAMNTKSEKTDIDIDVSGQNFLYIEVENIDFYEGSIVLSNAKLLR